MTAGALLERDDELGVLRAGLDRLVEDGVGGAVLVVGAAGMGRSALLEVALARCAAPVLWARGGPMTSGEPFGGLRQLLLPALRRLAPAERESVLSGPARLAARILGFGDDVPGDEVPDPFFSVRWLVEDLAVGAPLVLAVDDVHWIDEESGRVLTRLADRLEDLPVLLLLTGRPAEPGTTTPLADLRAAASVIELGPLSEAATGELVPGRDPGVAYALTGGVPLLVRHLADVPLDVPLEESRWDDVGARALAQAARVSPAAQGLVQALALYAEGGPWATVARTAGLDPREVAGDVDALVASGLLVGDEVLQFAAPMVARAVHDGLGTFARREGHAAAARVLREQGAGVEAVAAQLIQSTPGDDPDVVRVLREAAERVPGPMARLRHLERALAEHGTPQAERAELLMDVGRLRGRLGRPDAAEAFAEAADRAADRSLRARALLHRAVVLHADARNDETFDAVEQVPIADLPPDERLLTDALRVIAAMEVDRFDVVAEAGDRIPDGLAGDTVAERAAIGMRWLTHWGRTEPDSDNLTLLLRAVRQGEEPAFAEYGVVSFDPVASMTAIGAFDELDRLAASRLERARSDVDEPAYLTALLARGDSWKMRGWWRLAEAEHGAVLDHGGASADQRVTALEALIECYGRQQRAADAEAGLLLLAELGAAPLRVALRRAVYEEAMGVVVEQPVFAQVNEAYLAAGLTHPAQRRWWCSHAQNLARIGRVDEAREALEPYYEEAEQFGEAASIGEAATTLGRLVGGERGLELLERAVQVLDPSPHEWLRGWAQLRLGEALRRAGRRADSRPLLHSALAYAEQHGEASIARLAVEELRLAGGRSRETVARRPDDLTPAETRVARLAAQGRSNKEIAAELFLTVGSVQTTLVRVFRKLDIGSRQLLADALTSRGVALVSPGAPTA